MWRTNTLCTLANEDLGTLAEYDPLTFVADGPRGTDFCMTVWVVAKSMSPTF